MTTVFAVVVVLGGLIFFHELGHFAVARGLGMGVSVFSLGFGPKILKMRRGKTEYALSLVPLGGYVALVGESDEEDIPEGFTPEESFALRPAWQRLLVVAAGPLANMLLAWLLCWLLAFSWGATTLLPEIGAVNEDGPAAAAGLQAGDRILSINGIAVASWEDLSEAINASEGQPLSLEIARPASSLASNGDFTTLRCVVHPFRSARKTVFGDEENAWLIGVRASGKVVVRPLDFWSAAGEGANHAGRMISLTWQGLVKLVQRVVPLDQVGGPIMIMQLVGQQANEGLAGLLALTALISVNLGILNLLPIPVLDGGQIVFCLWETIFRRPIARQVQAYAMRLGVALLVCLMLLATFNDIWRIVKSAG
ncbi:MAG: RIP metalloprotease RseP [Desulfovibrio sp.]|jgi:regulator of sigma E protease|nr:RIP metalloprotease RseP [Desulfovibrio sp.]